MDRLGFEKWIDCKKVQTRTLAIGGSNTVQLVSSLTGFHLIKQEKSVVICVYWNYWIQPGQTAAQWYS